MTKNIIVIDEHGKKYGTTYPKRAKGLVKQGRARFQAQNVLCLMHCLACPPDQDLEDKNMSEQTIENKMMETETIERDTANGASANTGADTHAVGGQSKYTMEYCLEQIERIGRQTEYLNQAISELRQMEDSGLLLRVQGDGAGITVFVCKSIIRDRARYIRYQCTALYHCVYYRATGV